MEKQSLEIYSLGIRDSTGDEADVVQASREL